MEVSRNLLEGDIDPPLLVHAIALDLDACDISMKALSRERAEDNFHRLLHFDLAGLAFVNVGAHPDRLGIDQREHRFTGRQHSPKLPLALDDDGIIGRCKGVKVERDAFKLLLGPYVLDCGACDLDVAPRNFEVSAAISNSALAVSASSMATALVLSSSRRRLSMVFALA